MIDKVDSLKILHLIEIYNKLHSKLVDSIEDYVEPNSKPDESYYKVQGNIAMIETVIIDLEKLIELI